jgi:hypothetical protein
MRGPFTSAASVPHRAYDWHSTMNRYVQVTAAPTARSAFSTAAARVGAMGAAAVLLGQLTHPDSTYVICPLRALTGLPCPLCGGTTAAASAGRLRLGDALLANPFAVAVAVLFALIPLARISAQPRPKHGRSAYRQAALLGSVVVAAELWQLGRFGFLT